MNTPKPCDECKYLYYNAMTKDDPSDCASCKLGHPFPQTSCTCVYFKHWSKP